MGEDSSGGLLLLLGDENCRLDRSANVADERAVSHLANSWARTESVTWGWSGSCLGSGSGGGTLGRRKRVGCGIGSQGRGQSLGGRQQEPAGATVGQAFLLPLWGLNPLVIAGL